jgi:hypothetical protein
LGNHKLHSFFGKLGVLNIHSNLRGSVEDQTNKASAPTKSTKSDPIVQQHQMQNIQGSAEEICTAK